MDFTKDTTRQGKRLGEDVTSHSIAKRARESIFLINTSKPDLKLLKEAYGLLSSKEKYDSKVRFWCIGDLLLVVPDWDLFRAMLKFYVPKCQAIVFPHFELVPTLDEFHHFLQCSPAMDSCAFTPQVKILLIIAPRRKVFKKQHSPYSLKSKVIKMFKENIVTNPKKSAVDERVDKLEATMQTMTATLQIVSLTLSTLTTSSVPSPASLVPTTSAPPVIIPLSTITLGNHAKDPMVTQLQFPPIYKNQPLMGESSSHAPQISSLPSEASYPPLKMNNPTLLTTIPLTLNIPPLIGQVPAIQPNPSIDILSPALEDGKSRKDVLMPMMYARKMAPYANDERVLVHYFQDSLSGPASVWFLTLDKKNICSFKDVSQAFMRQYEYNINFAPTRDSLQRITKKSNETFKEFSQWWRSEAAKLARKPSQANSLPFERPVRLLEIFPPFLLKNQVSSLELSLST
ncbi:hypothetical protein SLEP1_g30726 [Rubroshorea leprosula]|uniref:Retrotransposon gag domain-containing protein n=1 Tax=Rubroshorea leprosula TaxID=152421 RepID=A0AAV5K9A8_9ROSI|nr:hypothetical protein SLEP1_g30726 [Rubroshorea leprosula]